MGVSTGGKYLKYAIVNREQRHVKSTAAKIKDQNGFLAILLVKSIRNGGGGRFVDHTLDGQPSDGPRILGRLPLRIVEIGRDGHHRPLHLRPDELLGRLLHLAQDHSGYLLGGELLVGTLAIDVGNLHGGLALGTGHHVEGEQCLVLLDGGVGKLPPDQPLHVEHRPGWVLAGLVLGRISDEPHAVLLKCHVRGGDAISLLVGTDLHPAVAPNRHAGVRGSQIDANARTIVGAATEAAEGSQTGGWRGCTAAAAVGLGFDNVVGSTEKRTVASKRHGSFAAEYSRTDG
mmetsp:Transcript_2567/g.7530  ORF Transcript_2567/g.7530 Transcript_2567/m.7530 type:complete len:288 (+) Transcript_2567:4138-5001(+)